MKLKVNTAIDGVWYGPDYGDIDLPPEVEARLGQPTAPPATVLAVQLRSRMLAGLTRMVDEQVLPAFGRLPSDEQVEALESMDDEFGGFITDIASRLAAAPDAPAAPGPLADDDVVVLAEGREYLRADLVEMADAWESTPPEGAPTAPEVDEVAEHQADDLEHEPPLEVPSGTVDVVLAWVNGGDPGDPPGDGWQDRAAAALKVERAEGNPRKTLVEPLELALAEAADLEAG